MGDAEFAWATFSRLAWFSGASKRNWPNVLVVVEPVDDEEAQLPDRNGKWGQLAAVPDEVPPVAGALE
ncbi:hypothetical protein G7043_08175 [Lentzea sp. NEAU-D13]|uniref:Uncharacterized protein n=1 Tax=Lentzea alba TaxID=2714351 RepID=A0A7C9VTM1_9PSEU|nr:hypothetical protein [Lentzea alba]NGY58901.1 hypothetical protein [Lentzea alba]